MIDVAYIHPPSIPLDKVYGVLAELQSLGVTDVILSETRAKAADGTYAWSGGNPDKTGLFLYEASQLGMGCYVGLVYSAGSFPVFEVEPNRSEDAADTDATVLALVNQFGGAHPALRGWAIPNEMALAYHTDPVKIADHHAYYAAQVNAIRQHSSLPVLTAPYLGGAYSAWDGSVQSPAQVAAKAVAFHDATGVDIQNWQDAAGAAPFGLFEWTRPPYTVADYMDALGVLGDGLWSDNELFTWGNPQFSGPGYHPAAMARIAHAVESSCKAVRKSIWLQPYHMGTVQTDHQPDSPRLLDAYRAWYGLGGEYIKPRGYTWSTAPLAAYPDSGSDLTDLVTGDPLNHADPSWVGVQGQARFWVDLGKAKPLRWVGCHVLHMDSQGIALPDSIRLETSTNASTWTDRGTSLLGISKSDGEFVLANATPLTVSARYVRVTLANAAKTFISEVEIT